MGNDSHKISRLERLLVAFSIFASVSLVGCHDWPDERVTGIEAQNILRELSEIEAVEEPNIPIPAVYTLPPQKVKQVVGGAEEWKLFYFAKYHTAEKIKQIIYEQFAVRVFDEKGQPKTVIQDYTVTANSETNQIIVRAPTEADIDAIQEVIDATDVPPIQVRIDCMVSELYADLTMDRETTLLIQNLFGEGVAMGGKVDTSGNLLPAFPGAALRDPAREKFGLKIGVSRGDEGHRFEALVDILVSRGYLKILMNPSLEVVNGQMAKIQAKEHVPLQQTFLKGGYGDTSFIETRTEYYDIIDSLQITPHVYADGYIGLETQAQIAAYLTPEGIKQLPIVTERIVTNKDNRIRHGESLIIGGIRKTEKRDVVRGVPILKDIPILNLLFSGRDFEERAKEVIFIITPTISTGGVPNQEMVNKVRERHTSPMTQALHERMADPLGLKAREQERERELEAARSAQQESDTRRTAFRVRAMQRDQELRDLRAELEQAKTAAVEESARAAEAVSKAQQAEQARIEAEKAKAEQAEKARIEAEKAKAEKAKAAEAEKARIEAEKAKAELEKAQKETPSPPNAQSPAGDAKETPPQNGQKTEKPKEEGKESEQQPPQSQGEAAKPQEQKQS
jgi:Flp pilus assembly secretin CpaC